MLQNIGQRHVFSLEWLPLFLELMCQADPPALVGHLVASLFGDIPAHQLCGGFVAPFCRHACMEICDKNVVALDKEQKRTHKPSC